jgi:hypothetical protein
MAVSAMRPMAGSVSYTSSALRYAFSLDSLATILVRPTVGQVSVRQRNSPSNYMCKPDTTGWDGRQQVRWRTWQAGAERCGGQDLADLPGANAARIQQCGKTAARAHKRPYLHCIGSTRPDA